MRRISRLLLCRGGAMFRENLFLKTDYPLCVAYKNSKSVFDFEKRIETDNKKTKYLTIC